MKLLKKIIWVIAIFLTVYSPNFVSATDNHTNYCKSNSSTDGYIPDNYTAADATADPSHTAGSPKPCNSGYSYVAATGNLCVRPDKTAYDVGSGNACHTANDISTSILEVFTGTGQGSKIFLWAIGVGAVLAFGVITYAGVLMSLSGLSEEKSKAKEYIKGAVEGLLLLIVAYVVLRVINPQLVTF